MASWLPTFLIDFSQMGTIDTACYIPWMYIYSLHTTLKLWYFLFFCWHLTLFIQAGVSHVILAVSYMSELLEREMRAQEERVSSVHLILNCKPKTLWAWLAFEFWRDSCLLPYFQYNLKCLSFVLCLWELNVNIYNDWYTVWHYVSVCLSLSLCAYVCVGLCWDGCETLGITHFSFHNNPLSHLSIQAPQPHKHVCTCGLVLRVFSAVVPIRTLKSIEGDVWMVE